MDIHIANCFPAYVEMMAFVDMTEIAVVTVLEEVEFWKTSLSAWGAEKMIVGTSI